MSNNLIVYDLEIDNIYNDYALSTVGQLPNGFNVFNLATVGGVLAIELDPTAFITY